jgi:hypothetical protein
MSLPFTSDESRTETGPSSLSPYEKFMYALNSKESKRQYPKRSLECIQRKEKPTTRHRRDLHKMRSSTTNSDFFI